MGSPDDGWGGHGRSSLWSGALQECGRGKCEGWRACVAGWVAARVSGREGESRLSRKNTETADWCAEAKLEGDYVHTKTTLLLIALQLRSATENAG